jgi:hypothetical protein
MSTGTFLMTFGALVYVSGAFGTSGDPILDMTREPLHKTLQRIALAYGGLILLFGGAALLAAGVP